MPLYVIGVGGLGIGGNIGTLGALGVGIPQQIRYQVFGCSRSLPRRTPNTGFLEIDQSQALQDQTFLFSGETRLLIASNLRAFNASILTIFLPFL